MMERSVVTTRLDMASSSPPPFAAPVTPSPPCRAGAMESISSIITTHGLVRTASLKTPRNAASDSPTTGPMSSGPRTTRRLAPAASAAARASRDLPVPGGPHSSTPLGGLIPNVVKISGRVSGSATFSRSASLNSETPPRSSKRTAAPLRLLARRAILSPGVAGLDPVPSPSSDESSFSSSFSSSSSSSDSSAAGSSSPSANPDLGRKRTDVSVDTTAVCPSVLTTLK
mmetsp:Transcript_8040/g.35545  ORF Transcript_8040/g.35545 Transcript_8040/m.35545 type:complete len:228 (-) Transcript_8040:1001-1684(-)